MPSDEITLPYHIFKINNGRMRMILELNVTGNPFPDYCFWDIINKI